MQTIKGALRKCNRCIVIHRRGRLLLAIFLHTLPLYDAAQLPLPHRHVAFGRMDAILHRTKYRFVIGSLGYWDDPQDDQCAVPSRINSRSQQIQCRPKPTIWASSNWTCSNALQMCSGRSRQVYLTRQCQAPHANEVSIGSASSWLDRLP